ncbi:replication factor A protein 3 [Terfezia claveryi]|nr:replication factor A protein 3 [Terfezia claveryi]
MSNEQTPRVNSSLLERFVGQTVRLVGKVMQLRGETATVDSAGNVLVHMNKDTHWSIGNFVEVVARVQQDLSLKTFMSVDLGRDVDMNAVEYVVEVNHRYREIFYDS